MNASKAYVPSGATRKANLPSEQYLYVAFAPWISAPCTKSYLVASTGARAFLTYVPDSGTNTPPLANNETWDLHDGGHWKSHNKFPVYAIPGAEGAAIMQAMAQYSHNSSDAKIGEILAKEGFDTSDFVRLYTTFGTSQSSSLPTLWAFLLIVLGAVLVILGFLSFSIHWVQGRRRRDLRRRVENGEVDLETLGVKRLRIPQEAIDSLPISIYTQNEEHPTKEDAPIDQVIMELSAEQLASQSHTEDASRYSQPTCSICLDDFVPKVTSVRTLPCHHIYHPSCIDPFLRDNSSLCPICKARVLPSNSKYKISEPITNYMVRHERRARRVRQRRDAGGLPDRPATEEEGENGRWLAPFRRGYVMGRRAFSAPGGLAARPTNSQVEMRVVERRAVSGPAAAAEENSAQRGEALESQPADFNGRRVWMRKWLSRLRRRG